MTELPPIIERLDALLTELSDCSDCPYFQGTGTCAFGCFTEPSCITDRPLDGWPKEALRAELLRLQEERDAWLQQHAEDTVRSARERDALLEALKDGIAIALLGDDPLDAPEAAIQQWQMVKDSLSDPMWSDGKHRGDCTSEAFTCGRCVYDTYSRAADALAGLIANVEGKE